MTRAYLGLGSNLGFKVGNLRRAIAGLRKARGVFEVTVSSFYKTSPVGKLDQDWFVNAVARIDTELKAGELLDLCLDLERQQGRERGERWGPRTIDVDVLLYGDSLITENDLVVPHPRLSERAFVLAPLLELGVESLPSLPSMEKRIADLHDQSIEVLGAKVAVLGASPKPERYSNRAMSLLLESGFPVVPISPRGGSILGEDSFRSLRECEGNVDTVTVYIGSDRLPSVLEDILAVMPRRVVLNPGTENAAVEAELENSGIEVVEGCTLVMLRAGLW